MKDDTHKEIKKYEKQRIYLSMNMLTEFQYRMESTFMITSTNLLLVIIAVIILKMVAVEFVIAF